MAGAPYASQGDAQLAWGATPRPDGEVVPLVSTHDRTYVLIRSSAVAGKVPCCRMLGA